jgi:GH24 family phage-related lysozyme (muramidase)
MNIDTVKAMLQANEGRIGYLYRCTGGKVTIGVGHACESASDACQLTLVTAAGTRASAEQIGAAYSAVFSAPMGLPAQHYRPYSDLNLPDAAIDELLNADISTFTASLRKTLPKFDSYPDCVQSALFDMAYNLGIGGLMKYPNLLNACAAGDWQRAAAESSRHGISDARNQSTAALFLQASSSANRGASSA